jgi:hypothetical protein
MATDQLILGGIAFDSWSTPERMPFGGKQAMAVHKLPGGARAVNTLGPDENDIMFTGQMYNNNAYGIADELDSMRIAGAQVPLTFAGRFYLVIIAEVHVDIRRFPQLVEYHVNCLVAQNNMAGILGAITSTVSNLVTSDMASAVSISTSLSTTGGPGPVAGAAGIGAA